MWFSLQVNNHFIRAMVVDFLAIIIDKIVTFLDKNNDFY